MSDELAFHLYHFAQGMSLRAGSAMSKRCQQTSLHDELDFAIKHVYVLIAFVPKECVSDSVAELHVALQVFVG